MIDIKLLNNVLKSYKWAVFKYEGKYHVLNENKFTVATHFDLTEIIKYIKICFVNFEKDILIYQLNNILKNYKYKMNDKYQIIDIKSNTFVYQCDENNLEEDIKEFILND